MKPELKNNLFEFLRYAVVGGISAVVDMGVNFLVLFYLLGGTKDDGGKVALAVAAGFLVGRKVDLGGARKLTAAPISFKIER